MVDTEGSVASCSEGSGYDRKVDFIVREMRK